MMSSDTPRDELITEVLRAIRQGAGQTALFSQAVAERLGLAGTDVECLDVLLVEGRLTVGRLAELTGLTTGSATRMVDRLEQAGFVGRVPDPVDRRRVLVEPVAGVEIKLGLLHDSIRTAQIDALARYDNDQLALLARFMKDLSGIAMNETAKMRAPSEEADAGGSYAAPVGGVTSGRLIFLSGAPRIHLRGDSTISELYKATFAGPVPRMRVRGGVVTVSYPRLGWFDWRAEIAGQHIEAQAHWRKDKGEIALNSTIPWAIELRGGVSSWAADLRSLQLESFELKGGASKIELRLGSPVGIVPIRVHGGMSRVSIERPVGVAAGLTIGGGVSEILVDGQSHKGSGHLWLQTPGADQAANRYEIEVAGGASKITISAR
jgi:DNA-binding MarR family transcriptional regulator